VAPTAQGSAQILVIAPDGIDHGRDIGRCVSGADVNHGGATVTIGQLPTESLADGVRYAFAVDAPDFVGWTLGQGYGPFGD